ncbi:hypothetical protein TrST_g8352 [Triparma strigata]|uniref:Sodefrin-like factor n=1 Tax=Triparma strigata TaxID=1606541 RepID=A0A9W7EKE8_9STRA|nr:hypothetical protein TrST_g8352 [Triparma strigata]
MKLFSLTLMALPSLTSAFGGFVDDGCVYCSECSEGELSAYFECSDDGSDVSLFRLKTGATDTCNGEYIEQSGHGTICLSAFFIPDDQLVGQARPYVKRFCEDGQPVQYYFEDQFCEQYVSWQEEGQFLPTKAQGCFCEPPESNVFPECGWGCSACLVNSDQDQDCMSTCAAEDIAFSCGFCAQYVPTSWSDVDGNPTVLAQTCSAGAA